MKISKDGINLIKHFEGLRLTAYKAVSSERFYTIGYGHYGKDVKKDEKITKEQAQKILENDLQRFVNAVNNSIKVNINQNQFDSLVSLCYNIGTYAFKTSTLVKLINENKFGDASKEFMKWVHSGGKVLQGLVRRRKLEMKMFEQHLPTHKQTPIKQHHVYSIKKGDTLSAIASDYNTTVKELLKLNPSITNENLIITGDELNVPEKPVKKFGEYTIKFGDTLTKIANDYKTSVDYLMKINPQIKNKNLIITGDKIKVPK